ncbi:hypothetical protein D1632_12900 [Chryseobacterium nematophagum]|uniref:Gliding motility-associated C-terminal domain-containing protein n=1 Tax=Chryseobacterium nematophagum TaxID=2305228 RepID=A0A3M7L6Z6_9FLAO|nr:T9SS type B sorting domain-containing protein [Chryseobacterium nematophagum]RMZ58503.1 hypothetical protein D1632_12900 [Chryseobacterium nematophagum]
MKKKLQFLFLLIGIFVFSQTVITPVKVKDSFGNEDLNVTCNNNLDPNGCLTLNVEYPVLKQTTSYEVNSQPYAPPIAMNEGKPLNANYDDLFAVKLDLPFKFCFFNQYFDALVVGSNGMVTFDLSQLGNINYPNVQWQNPNVSLPKNSIFGAYHDMVFSAGDQSEIYYSTIGTAPYRKFIINFYEGRITGCTDRSSSQIVLNETTNVVEVFIDKKPMPCPTRKFENALIGVLNSDGTSGFSPASRNTGVWQALQEGWRFNPLGNVINPEITWTNSGGQTVGTGIQTTICPTQNDVYTANVKFNICGNSELTLTDTFNLTFDPTYPVAKNYTQDFCSNAALNVDLTSFKANLTSQNPANFIFTFHSTLQDAQNGSNILPTDYTLTSNTIIYVRIQNPNVPACFRTATLTLNYLNKSLIKTTVEICDTNNNGIEHNYNLTLLNEEILPLGTTGISYHLSQSDAQNNVNAITTVDITNNMSIWVRLQEVNCTYILGPIIVQFKPGVNINSPINFTYSMCDINADGQELFDYTSHLGSLITTQQGAVFTVYSTYDEAFAGIGSVLETIKEGQYQIFIRVQIPNECFAVVQVNMDVTFTKILANQKNVYICFNGTEDVTINLSSLSSGMLVSPTTVPVTEFYPNYTSAMNGNNPIGPNQVITEDGNLVKKTYYIRFEESNQCFTVRAINVYLVHPVIAKSSFTICDFNNDNLENVQLSQFTPAIIDDQNATTLFYLTQSDAQNSINPITQVGVTGTRQVFVKITSHNCQEIYPMSISLVSTPVVTSVVNIALNGICDNNNDGVEIYNLIQAQSQIYSGTDVAFTYYTSFNPVTYALSGEIINPSQFGVQGNATVYVKVKFNNNSCFSVSQLNINMTFLPVVVLNNAVLNKCDENFDLSETFQLNVAIPQLFVASQNTYPLSDITISYYNTSAEANAGVPSTQIGNSIVTNISSAIVWARFQANTTGCYSVARIQLNTYFPPKSINSTITVCDENLDGVYEVNLLDYTQQMVDISNPINTFTFYLTEQDAQNGVNPITNPSNFTAQPFPSQIWVKVQNISECDDIAVVNLVLGTKLSLQNTGPFQLNDVCDINNDGVENVNLTQFQQQIYAGSGAVFTYYPSLADLNAGINAISSPSNYTFNQSSGSVIYVKVSGVSGFCAEKVEIHITLKPVPIFDIPTQYICSYNTLNYTVHVENYTIVNYVWTDPSGMVISTTDTITGIKMLGTYTLTVTAANGCTYTDTFELKYYDVPTIQEVKISGTTATVYATGVEVIEYSIDGVTWQSSNVFHNLPTGVITFYVKYVEGKCVVKQENVILDIKNAITPNGDNMNDKWIVKNLHVFGERMTNVKVFDRYQAVIFEQNTNTQIVWDGTIAGRAIPTSSYWYIITLPDGRTFTGWILVKNNQ